MCTKNGGYCEKEKSQGGARVDVNGEAFVKIQKKILGGRGEGRDGKSGWM